MGFYLDNYQLSNREIFTSVIKSEYGVRHWDKGSSHWLHYAIALIEFTPILGPLASAIEWICFKTFEEKNRSGSCGTKNSPGTFSIQNNQICRNKNGKMITYNRDNLLGEGLGAMVYSLKPNVANKNAKAVKWYKTGIDPIQKNNEKSVFFSDVKWPLKVTGVLIPKAMLDIKEESVMIMPLCDGTLADKITTLSEAEQISAIDQLIQGVVEIHSRGVVNGEINLSNIMTREKKGRREYLISDFGMGGKDQPTRGDIVGLRAVIRAIIVKSTEKSFIAGPIQDENVPNMLKEFNNSIGSHLSIGQIQEKWKAFRRN